MLFQRIPGKINSVLVDVVRGRIEGSSGVEIGLLRAAKHVDAPAARRAGAADPRWF